VGADYDREVAIATGTRSRHRNWNDRAVQVSRVHIRVEPVYTTKWIGPSSIHGRRVQAEPVNTKYAHTGRNHTPSDESCSNFALAARQSVRATRAHARQTNSRTSGASISVRLNLMRVRDISVSGDCAVLECRATSGSCDSRLISLGNLGNRVRQTVRTEVAVVAAFPA
jgi:hypothetical protein